ncbi:hypothetical protein G4B88_011666 [Cannabis sativa]|uniref:Uncharacterized protein n=1 Tax=Cannabis sativa TaxID=3483 RepID=A0A7J6FS58_CANSA|nr:hypothetical protein G4B88_011666 [Cannabis sativa]
MEHKLLKICQSCKSLREMKQTHLQILIHGFQDSSFTVPKLLTVSSQLGFIDYAFRVFRNCHFPNVVVYNTLIKCFVGKDSYGCDYAFHVYDQMKVFGVAPNSFTFTLILRCFESFEALKYGEVIHCEIVKLERNIVTWNSVISGLSKAGNMELACIVFEKMTERNEVSWNSIISGYVRLGDVKSARCVFDDMPEKTVVSWTAMVSGYTMVGDLKSARSIFDQMPVKNVVSWNAMIAGYVHNHMFDQALQMFSQMLIDRNCRPDETTLVSVLSACSHLGSLEHGRWVDSYIKRSNFSLSIPLGNALMDMFAKCGDVENAKVIFHKMPKRCIITWTTMVSGLSVNGKCKEALNLFDSMCGAGVKPDDVIFIAVLSACTHGGFVEDGKRIFCQMVSEFGVKPRIEHYGCMVDLLGRAGKLEEAVGFVESMPLEPNAVIWATLLGSCKIHGNENLLDSVTKKIIEQEPSNPSYLTLISNLSASVGRWKDALTYRMAMSQQGVEKVPGCSSIQIGNVILEFLARDTRHEERKDIYEVLYCLRKHLDTSSDETL